MVARMVRTVSARGAEEMFFWTAASHESEFAAEDPLALDYIAQQVGLFILPTLTTRTPRAQAFAVVIYGLHLVERAIRERELLDDDEIRRALFERWERFWAMAVLESRGGVLRRGDPDAMRGVRGAVKAWYGGEKALPLDYPLISRQQELGSLGAYLAPLRLAGLVVPGTLRPSPAADEILDAFWDEPHENARTSRYAEYALLALDTNSTRVERKHAGLTLAKVGARSRLSCLTGSPPRSAQQDRLYRALFVHARDATTLQIAQVVEESAKANVTDARVVLDGAIDGRWGACDARLTDLLRTARAFGDAMQVVLAIFDRTYAALSERGWHGKRKHIASAVLDDDALVELRKVSAGLLAAPEQARIRALPTHGAAFMRLIDEVRAASAEGTLAAVLAYHARVQRDRQRGDAWIRDGEGDLTLFLTTYTARPAAVRFPGFKLNVVRSLLVDMGRLPVSANPEEVPS